MRFFTILWYHKQKKGISTFGDYPFKTHDMPNLVTSTGIMKSFTKKVNGNTILVASFDIYTLIRTKLSGQYHPYQLKELIALSGRSRAQVYKHLKSLKDNGHLVQGNVENKNWFHIVARLKTNKKERAIYLPENFFDKEHRSKRSALLQFQSTKSACKLAKKNRKNPATAHKVRKSDRNGFVDCSASFIKAATVSDSSIISIAHHNRNLSKLGMIEISPQHEIVYETYNSKELLDVYENSGFSFEENFHIKKVKYDLYVKDEFKNIVRCKRGRAILSLDEKGNTIQYTKYSIFRVLPNKIRIVR